MEGYVNRILLNQIFLLVVVVSLVNQVSGMSRFARMVENDAHETQDALPASEGFLVVPGGTKCFKIFHDCNCTWTEAVTKCRSHGLQLAEPRDTVAVRKYIVDNYGDGATWVGARGEGVNMRWIGSQRVLPDDSPLWYTSSPGNEVSRDYCLSLLTDSDSMLDKPEQPYSALECSAMLTSTLCEEVAPQLPSAHPEPTGRLDDLWSRQINGCFRNNLSRLLSDVTFADCQDACERQNGCRSVEYHSRQRKCYISADHSGSFLFESPCPAEGWTFTEILFF